MAKKELKLLNNGKKKLKMLNYKSYKNSAVVERYAKTERLDIERATEHFYALKDFLKLSTATEKPCFPSKDLDEIWHTFILFTKDYKNFCLNILGKFVHHIPFVNDEDKIQKFKPGYFCYIENKKFKKRYVRTLRSLELNFKADCGSGGDCSSACSSCKD